MSFRIMAEVWRRRVPHKLILLKLADCADDDGGSIYPSVAAVAGQCNSVSDRTIQRALRQLEGSGLISLVDEARQHRPRIYQISLDALARRPEVGGDMMKSPQGSPQVTEYDASELPRVTNPAPTGDKSPRAGAQVQESVLIQKVSKQDTPPVGTPPKKLDPDDDEQKPKRSPGTRLTAEWCLDEKDRGFAECRGYDPAAIGDIADEFRDHWVAKAGANGVKRDWHATWRNWVRRQGDFGRGNGVGRAATGGTTAAVARATRRFAEARGRELGNGVSGADSDRVSRGGATATGGDERGDGAGRGDPEAGEH